MLPVNPAPPVMAFKGEVFLLMTGDGPDKATPAEEW